MIVVASTTRQRLRRRAASAAVLGFLSVGAWVASIGSMRGTGMAGRFSVGSLGFFVVLWVLMMAAMMFPSVWPAAAVFRMVVGRRATVGASLVRSAGFVGGYLGSWTAFGLAAFALLAGARAFGLEELSAEEIARYVVAPVALAGAAYQLAPFKQACLRHCRGPLSFFLGHWREGVQGAFVMGARHGGYCVGCCWMLMLVLLAVGAMSLTWMAVVSMAIAIEKLAPARSVRAASRLLTAALATLALIALLKPSILPTVGMDPGAGMHDENGR